MRVLGPIVEPLVLAVIEPKVHRRSRGPIRSELVCDHDARRRDGGFEEFSHEPAKRPRRPFGAGPGRRERSLLIDGAPQPVPLAGDRHDDLASRAVELHLRALLEPYVTLSSHTAPDVRSSTCT